MDKIEWIEVGPGKAILGSNRRSILTGGVGPRHQVSIDRIFEISKYPVNPVVSRKMIEAGDASLASESEWALAKEVGAIHANYGTSEALADSITSYWGKQCDGRPYIQHDSVRHRRIRTWKKKRITESSRPEELTEKMPKRLVRRKTDYSGDALVLPHRGDSARIIFEEIVICMCLGVVPSFVWALFNASPGYIAEGWLNLTLGGIFLGISTAVIWRPKTPTYIQEGDKWRLG